MGKGINRIILPCLCCMSVYTGSQFVGSTEAAFTSQAIVKPDKISTAFVFPSYVQGLEEKAQVLRDQILQAQQKITQLVEDPSFLSTEDPISEFAIRNKQITAQVQDLNRILDELAKLDREARERTGYQFVNESFQKVDKLVQEMGVSIKLQELEEILLANLTKHKEETQQQEEENTENNSENVTGLSEETGTDPEEQVDLIEEKGDRNKEQAELQQGEEEGMDDEENIEDVE